MRTCYIVGAAPFMGEIRVDPDDLLIAADGGWLSLRERALTPHLAVGDFDSSEVPDGIPIVRHPVEKDDTDTALAVREGMRRGYTHFVLYGCTGGRPDHTLAAIGTLHRMAKEGLFGYLVFEGMVATVVYERTLCFSPRGTVSVLSLSDVSEGVTLKGLKYPLADARLTSDTPLGVSNEGYGTEACVTVKKGALLVLWAV